MATYGYDKLYVSCDSEKTKASGSLYEFVKKENNIKDTSKWLHIGDNVLADIQNAKSKGIETHYYKPPRQRAEYIEAKTSIQESIMTAININDIYNGKYIDRLEKLGKESISPIFYGFCDWLSKMTYSQEKIIFLSRDGHFPKQVFELLKEKRGLKTQTQYLYTSRKAYQIPAYVLMTKKEAIEQLTLWNSDLDHKLKIKEIYKQVGLDSKKFEKEILSLGLKSEEEVLTVQNRDKVKKLISLTFGAIRASLEEKLSLVKEYLETQGINNLEQINVMDIGWRGSVQHAMQKILDKDIIGFYFGTTENLYEEVRLNSFGYFFDAGLPFENKQFVVDNIMMFELIFNSSEQSLNSFKRDENGNVVPVFSNKENTYKNELTKIQDAALESIKKIIEYDDYLSGISSKVCLKNYINFVKEKNYEDMIAFKKLSNDVGVNDDDAKYVTSISKVDFLKKNEKAFKKIKYSLWRDAYVIEGIDSEQELEEFYKKNNIKYKKKVRRNSDNITYIQKIVSVPYSIYYGTKNNLKKIFK